MADMYMRNVRDWREATLMLSFEEKGYFDEILNLIYMYDDLLPDDDDFICRAMPVNRKIHSRLKAKLIKAGLINIKSGYYFNKRASQEIAKINEISEKNQLKARSRWSKSLKNKEMANATADTVPLKKTKQAHSTALLKVKRESESENGNKRTEKCTIDQIIDPDGSIPEEFRKYAETKGLVDIQRRFEDWAGWWLSENGRKAGARGWLQTWKARVRKDVDRQMAEIPGPKGRSGNSHCSTTEGARLALDRRRNRKRKV